VRASVLTGLALLVCGSTWAGATDANPRAAANTQAAISSGHRLAGAAHRIAHAAEVATVLTVDGGPGANRVAAYVGAGGRLTLTSPEGIKVPPTPAGECTQDTATQISCDPGYVQAVVGDLGAGPDTFVAAPDLPVLIGAVIDGARRPLSGGPGRDRIVGGAGADLIDGSPGRDRLIGGGGDDLLLGRRGDDRLRGGPGDDALRGGGGSDRLDGGPGSDLCSGGPGRDFAVECEALRSVP